MFPQGAGANATAELGEGIRLGRGKSLGTAAGLGANESQRFAKGERVPSSEGALEILVKAEREKAAAGAAQAEGRDRGGRGVRDRAALQRGRRD